MCALGGRIKLHQTKLRVPRASLCTHVCNILLLSGSKKCYQASAGWWKHRVNHHWTSEQYSPPLSPVLDAHSNNQAGREGASLQALLTPELIEKTWSPGPSCGPADPSIPLSPSLNSIIPPWPGVHFIKHAIMHSNSCVDKARQSVDWPHKDPKRKKKKQSKQFFPRWINVQLYILDRSHSWKMSLFCLNMDLSQLCRTFNTKILLCIDAAPPSAV